MILVPRNKKPEYTWKKWKAVSKNTEKFIELFSPEYALPFLGEVSADLLRGGSTEKFKLLSSWWEKNKNRFTAHLPSKELYDAVVLGDDCDEALRVLSDVRS